MCGKTRSRAFGDIMDDHGATLVTMQEALAPAPDKTVSSQ